MASLDVAMQPSAVSEATPPPPRSPITCSLCCEEKPKSAFYSLSRCSHDDSCRECLAKWIEKAEAAGHNSHAACPFCRIEMTAEETFAILGRPFQAKAASIHNMTQELDQLTLQWLQQHAKQCPGCGAFVEKMPDSCDLMECLCGYRWCFGCGTPGATCGCTPAYHMFWDNVLDRQADSVAPPAATANATTGEVDLKTHIASRKQKEHANRIRQERSARREKEALERLEGSRISALWLYCGRKPDASLRILQQLSRGQSIRWVRGRRRREEVKEQRDMTMDAGKWLYSTKDGGFRVLRTLYSKKSIKRRSRRAKVRANNSKPLEGVDAAFSSGKWLYCCKENSKTLRQVQKFSKHQKNETGVHFDRWFSVDDFWCACNEPDCDFCQDSKEEAEDNAARIRVMFLNEEAKTLELKDIAENGL